MVAMVIMAMVLVTMVMMRTLVLVLTRWWLDVGDGYGEEDGDEDDGDGDDGDEGQSFIRTCCWSQTSHI